MQHTEGSFGHLSQSESSLPITRYSDCYWECIEQSPKTNGRTIS